MKKLTIFHHGFFREFFFDNSLRTLQKAYRNRIGSTLSILTRSKIRKTRKGVKPTLWPI